MEILINSKAHGMHIVLIDDEDFNLIKDFTWHLNPVSGGKFYVQTNIWKAANKQRSVKMHNIILPPKEGYVVDHINDNPLDNRKCNLRLATPHQNFMNKMRHKDSRVGYKGVTWHKKSQKYMAAIMVNYKQIYGGVYNNPIDAALRYNELAIKYHGEYASLNEINHGNQN